MLLKALVHSYRSRLFERAGERAAERAAALVHGSLRTYDQLVPRLQNVDYVSYQQSYSVLDLAVFNHMTVRTTKTVSRNS